MSKLVNLRIRRKQAARDAARKAGDAKAAQHGIPKAARDLAQARADKAARDHAAHRRETGDD